MSKHNVIIVREQDETVSCCIPLDGQFLREKDNSDLFSFNLDIKSTGDLYRELKEEFQDRIEVTIVDPRNPLYLIPKLTREALNNKIPFLQALKTIFLYRTPAVICDGELLSSGKKEFDQSLINTIRNRIESS